MFQARVHDNRFVSAASLAERVYHATVRQMRKSHGNAVIGLILNIFQSVILVAVFYVMFSILGLRSVAVRGDFLIYVMTGIFLFLTHTKTMGAIVASEGPASPMMQHGPMNTAIAISSAALGALYIQFLSAVVILTLYYVIANPFTLEDPIGVLSMFLLAWFSGVAVGMVFLAAKPWAPGLIGIVSTIYQRANMIASGKMFLANTLTPAMLAMFDWNPLFHTIDQSRGFAFINYNPHNSSIEYPLYVSIALIMIGLMGEFYTRRHASQRRSARR